MTVQPSAPLDHRRHRMVPVLAATEITRRRLQGPDRPVLIMTHGSGAVMGLRRLARPPATSGRPTRTGTREVPIECLACDVPARSKDRASVRGFPP